MIPYFLIKVFNVVMAILSVLGFYAYLPNVTSWLYLHPDFPLRNFLIGLDNQTLQLLFFAFLLLLILVKVKCDKVQIRFVLFLRRLDVHGSDYLVLLQLSQCFEHGS